MDSNAATEHDAWLSVFVVISDEIFNTSNISCPNCGEKDVDFQYVGYVKSRLGYLQIWCRTCRHGIHFSRVRAPAGVPLLPIDSAPDVIAHRIPKITEVEPS